VKQIEFLRTPEARFQELPDYLLTPAIRGKFPSPVTSSST